MVLILMAILYCSCSSFFSYVSKSQVTLHNKHSKRAGIYIENNMPDLEFMSRLLGITEIVRLITILNMMISYYLVFFLRKGQNILTTCKNISVDNLCIAFYDP